MPRSPRAVDPVRVVEALYDVSGDSEDWLRNTSSALEPRLGAEFALMGVFCAQAKATPPVLFPDVTCPLVEVALTGRAKMTTGMTLWARKQFICSVSEILVLQGHSRQQIAHKRGVALQTVNNQLASAFARLGVESRHELVDRVLAR
jgi:hypothetical protein